jgi:hypothetical protein
MTPKALPQAGVFFLDSRELDKIRSNFATQYMGMMPEVVDPSMNQGKWRFTLSGPDTSIVYYPPGQRMRTLEIDYDPRGFLTHIDETIGQTSMRPSLAARIDLTAGP